VFQSTFLLFHVKQNQFSRKTVAVIARNASPRRFRRTCVQSTRFHHLVPRKTRRSASLGKNHTAGREKPSSYGVATAFRPVSRETLVLRVSEARRRKESYVCKAIALVSRGTIARMCVFETLFLYHTTHRGTPCDKRAKMQQFWRFRVIFVCSTWNNRADMRFRDAFPVSHSARGHALRQTRANAAILVL
jgi:hypothetical protein